MDELDERDQADATKVNGLLGDAANYKLLLPDHFDPNFLPYLDEQKIVEATANLDYSTKTTLISNVKILNPDLAKKLIDDPNNIIRIREALTDHLASGNTFTAVRIMAEGRLIDDKFDLTSLPKIWPKLMASWRDRIANEIYDDIIYLASSMKICTAKEVIVDDKGIHITMPDHDSAKFELPQIRNF